MAESNMVASVGTTNDIKNNMLQRPTSLTVAQPSSPPAPGGIKNTEHIKTPSPLKHHSGTTIIQIPPSPNQKLPPTSPTSLEASTTGTNVAQPTTSFSFMEMASSFFRWGGKGGSSATATTSQTEIVTSKIEASPKSTTVDVEGPVVEQPTKSIKSSIDRAGPAPIINVITNPNENIKLVNAPVNSNVTVSAVSGKQRTSRKTMRAPQPPITGTPKLDSMVTNQESTQHSSPDAADVQEKTEEKLLKLLSDFNSGKVTNLLSRGGSVHRLICAWGLKFFGLPYYIFSKYI